MVYYFFFVIKDYESFNYDGNMFINIIYYFKKCMWLFFCVMNIIFMKVNVKSYVYWIINDCEGKFKSECNINCIENWIWVLKCFIVLKMGMVIEFKFWKSYIR